MAWTLASWLACLSAWAQIFVYPRRAEKSHIVYGDFRWQQIDILVGPKAEGETRGIHGPPLPLQGAQENSPTPRPAISSYGKSLNEKSGGVRLYFYEKERNIAEYAVASIDESYRQLVEQFQYVPTQTFPYILYNTYQEFLQTNLFPIQEGVLGVTSPENLKLTLPYMGDHSLFRDVSSHELAHQFTLQKLRSLAKETKSLSNPLELFPLWFIEGLAEFYAKKGISQEAEMLVRDILLNPNVSQGYALLDFFEDRPFSVLWTYQAGNVRCGFLEETYGKGFLQQALNASAQPPPQRVPGFAKLLENLTGDAPSVISQKFEAWLKRRSYHSYLTSEQDVPSVRPWPENFSPQEMPLTFAANPNGNVLLYKSIAYETGDVRLFLVHRLAPSRRVMVALDKKPGNDSMHPMDPRNLALGRNHLAFVAESRSQDSLIWQSYEDSTKLNLGPQKRIDLASFGVVGAFSPAFSPDEKKLAFVGMNASGIRDIYVVSLDASEAVEKLTDDAFTERQLSWGPQGIVYSSDATSHRHFNLFLVSPKSPHDLRRLTTHALDDRDPVILPDGRLFFVAYENAKSNLFEFTEKQVVKRTDVVSGIFDPHPGPNGQLWVLLYRQGTRHLATLSSDVLLQLPPETQTEDFDHPALPSVSLVEAEPYKTFSPRNWDFGPIFGFFGGGVGGVAGQLLASMRDRLNNHSLVLNLGIYGSFDLTDGYLLYVNQEKRLTYGTGLFQSLRFRQDKTFPDVPLSFFSGERFYGALGSLRYPFNRYTYVQTNLSLGAASYFLLKSERSYLSTPEFNPLQEEWLTAWQTENAGARLQAEATLRLGYDTLRYHAATGPIAGTSALLEGTVTVQPFHQQTYGSTRLDIEHYINLLGRTHVLLRTGVGLATQGRFAREFFLSSFDTLRSVRFGDTQRLLGRDYFYSTAELQFPLNNLLRIVLLTDLEGVVALDFGGVGNEFSQAFDKRVLAGVLGLNLGLGPFVLRLHFAKNISVGSPYGYPENASGWVTNFSIGIAGLGLPLGMAPNKPGS